MESAAVVRRSNDEGLRLLAAGSGFRAQHAASAVRLSRHPAR